MIPTPPHTKVRTTRTYDNGTADISSHSMLKQLTSVKQEISQTVRTSSDTLAADVMKCLQPVTYREASELTIRIDTHEATGEPRLITKTWTVHKEYYGH